MKQKRFNHNKNINIGTYYLAPYARTEAHIKAAAECGLDFFVNIPNDHLLLNLLNQYNMGAIVTGIFPSWFGGDGSNAGQMAEKNPITLYENAINHFIDAPNILGIDTGDEPSCLEFPHYGKIFSCIQKALPHLQPYLNIYPSYAVKGSNTAKEILTQHQCDNYFDYIETYCKHVPSDYICFDYYLYSASLEGLYNSLITVADACRRYQRKMFMVLQVNSHEPDVWISINKLRFQAFTAMAFGVDTIIWACYTAGWWYNHVLDKEGNKTEQYNKLKKVNSEIHFLGTEYMNYHYEKTYFIGKHPISNVTTVDTLSTSYISQLKGEHDEALLVSTMQSTNGNALFICASSDCYDTGSDAFSITFHSTFCNVTLLKNETRTTLIPDVEGNYTFSMCPNEGAFLTFVS